MRNKRKKNFKTFKQKFKDKLNDIQWSNVSVIGIPEVEGRNNEKKNI